MGVKPKWTLLKVEARFKNEAVAERVFKELQEKYNAELDIIAIRGVYTCPKCKSIMVAATDLDERTVCSHKCPNEKCCWIH